MLGCRETFHAVLKADHSALVEHLYHFALMDRTYSEDSLEYIPGILFKLLVAERETTVVLVDFENLNFDVGTDLSKFRGVFNLLGPREVADVDESVNAFLDFNE